MAKDAERIRRGERSRSKSGGKNRSDPDKHHQRPEKEDDEEEQLHQEPENTKEITPMAKKTNKPTNMMLSDGETSSIMSGFIFTGMDREMAEEFVSMTRNQQLNSLDSSVVRNSPLNP